MGDFTVTLNVTPNSGPTGTAVDVTGKVECPDVPTGGGIILFLQQTDPDTGAERSANLGTFPKSEQSTIDARVTIPSKMGEKRPGAQTETVPVRPGVYRVNATCSQSTTNRTSGGEGSFTVTASSTTTTTSTTTPSTTSTTFRNTPPTTAGAPSSTKPGTVSPTSANPGQSVTISGDGFAPNQDLPVTLNSDPVSLGTVRTDAAGAYRATKTIPRATAPGTHTITVQGIAADGVTRLTTVAPLTVRGGRLPATGTSSTPFGPTLGMVALTLGGLLLALARARGIERPPGAHFLSAPRP